ncbi:PspC domain-containing protein [Streptomyces bugieae]|uniref:PspC domain-containing protein n=1 Tax=Streptomyces bugieae TaxID=3098223 RepID=A0ABU7NQS8_9ACTN|nr:PspC domain-containing protein [Streptomyces sp. DSM 41528]
MNEAAPVAEPAPSDPAGPTPPHPPLRRSRRHKVVAGVCGGLGRQWDLDPVIFRIVLAVLSVGGVGLILYGFAWLAIPLDGEEENEGRRLLSGRVEGSALTALLVALVGCGLFLTTLAKGSMMSFAIMLLLAVGGSAYWSRRRRQAEAQGPESMDAATAQAVADAPPETKAPPVPASPSWWRDPRSRDAAGGGYLWGPETTPLPLDVTYRFTHGADATTASGQGTWSGAGRPPGPPVPAGGAHPVGGPRRNRRPGRPIGGRTFLLALFGGAGTALAVARHTTFVPSVQAGLAAALVVFGLGLVLSAWFGRTGGGTVFLMVLTALMLAGVTVLPRTFTADWQNRSWTPTTIAAVQPHYALGSGSGELDLSELPLKGGRTVHTRADVGAGRLQVTLPPGVTTRLHISLGLGDIRLPGEAAEHVELLAGGQDKTITLPADGLKKGEKPHGVLDLDLSVGAGQVDIQRATPVPAPTPSTSASSTPVPSTPVPSATASPSATTPTAPAAPRPAAATAAPTRQGAPQ